MLGQQRLTAKLSLTQVSTLVSFAPSSSTIPSVWRSHVPLGEETIIALRDAGLTELLHLLRADEHATYAPAVPFVEALKSNRVFFWRGNGQLPAWFTGDAPQVLRGRELGVSRELDRSCLEATAQTIAKKERYTVFHQVQFDKAEVPDLGEAHHLISTWFRANDINHVYWTIDVSVGRPLSPPAEVTRGQVVFDQGIDFAQKANITPKFTFVDTHIGMCMFYPVQP